MNVDKRKLILGERVMYVEGAVPVNCVFTVSLRGSLSPGSLQVALRGLQRKHPLLRASIRRGPGGRPWFQLEGQAPEIPVQVIERQTAGDWLKVVEAQWEIGFDVGMGGLGEAENGQMEMAAGMGTFEGVTAEATSEGMGSIGGAGPLARVIWLQSAEVSELILVCPHCVCDGTTGVTLMREMLALLDRPQQAMEAYGLFGSVQDLVASALLPGWRARWKGILKSLAARVVFALKPVGLPAPGGRNYTIHWRLDTEMTELLVNRCRSEGSSVYAALCVAWLDAWREVKKDAARNKVICPVDIRRYVQGIKTDMMFAFAPIIELSASPGDDFWERSRRLRAEMSEKVSKIKAHELLLCSEYYHPAVKKLIRFLCSDAGSHDFTFSNMGRLDIPEHFDTFSVEAVYSPTVAFPWRNPTTVVVSSFRGQMDFALVSNTGWLRNEEGMEIKESAMRVLREWVGRGHASG
jgi:hypothetical protein